MKKNIFLAVFATLMALPLMAQNYQGSRFYNHRTGRLDYSNRNSRFVPRNDAYVGLRIGPSFTTVNSDDPYLDGGSLKTGLDLGFVAGFAVNYYTPLFFETGLFYTEKGGKQKSSVGKFTYNLNYLEMPLLLKYKYYTDYHFSIQPYVGGYIACGVGGKIKDFQDREAYPSFSDKPYSFQRFDGGLKFGVGAQYDNFYVELGYDLGLSNISHDSFDTSHNGALKLNVGFDF